MRSSAILACRQPFTQTEVAEAFERIHPEGLSVVLLSARAGVAQNARAARRTAEQSPHALACNTGPSEDVAGPSDSAIGEPSAFPCKGFSDSLKAGSGFSSYRPEGGGYRVILDAW